jgi:hypothetical protein
MGLELFLLFLIVYELEYVNMRLKRLIELAQLADDDD